jgi:hypothetical protein
MANPTKLLYAKFRIGKTPPETMDAFLVSEDRGRVDNWKADERLQSEASESTELVSLNTFEKLADSFEKSISVFQNTVPFLMQMMPILLQLMHDRSIRRFVRKHGACLEEGQFETYSLGIQYFGELNRRIEKSVTLTKGVISLPNMFLVGLVSAYDKFLSDLIRVIFLTKPEFLSSSERNLSFRDLMEIGSIEAARERIIEKEIETVIRKSHSEQISWLESKLKMPLTKGLEIWSDFIEICERRNLFTHTGGIISEQYIKICNEHGCSVGDCTIGQVLTIDPEYYTRAVEVVLEFGMKLVQVIWRKFLPTETDDAENNLNHFSYRLITQKNYKLAAKMLKFGLTDMKKHGTEATRKMMVVNYANAEKLGGNVDVAREILDREDWSASTDRYRICVAAVKDEIETVISLMPRVVETKEMRISDFREWPVFETVRADPRFVEVFERSFSEKLLADRESTKPRDMEIGTGLEDDSADAISPAARDQSTIH